MKTFSLIFFFLNLTLFAIFSMMTLARYTLFPDIWSIMIRHPVQSLYLGCYPMGLTTLITIGVGLIHQDYNFGGKAFIYLLWAIWWFDVALSFAAAIIIVHIMYVSYLWKVFY